MPSRDAWGVGQVWGSRPSCITCCCVPDGAVPGAGQGRGPRGLSEPSLALEPGAGRRGEPSPGTLGMGSCCFPGQLGLGVPVGEQWGRSSAQLPPQFSCALREDRGPCAGGPWGAMGCCDST